MGTLIRNDNFTDSLTDGFSIKDYEIVGKFNRIELNPNKQVKTISDVKPNVPISTIGKFYASDNVFTNIPLGKVTPLDSDATMAIKNALESKYDDFDCIISPDTDLKFKGSKLPYGRVSNGHYTKYDKGENLANHIIYGQIDNISLDPSGNVKKLSKIESGKPVKLQGELTIYDRFQNRPDVINNYYGTHTVQLGIVTPTSQKAADSLRQKLTEHDLNLVVDKSSSVAFAGSSVPTGIVSNNSHVKLHEMAQMRKAFISYGSTINVFKGSIENSKLIGVDTDPEAVITVKNSVIDKSDTHAIIEHSQLGDNTEIVDSKIGYTIHTDNSQIISSKIDCPDSDFLATMEDALTHYDAEIINSSIVNSNIDTGGTLFTTDSKLTNVNIQSSMMKNTISSSELSRVTLGYVGTETALDIKDNVIVGSKLANVIAGSNLTIEKSQITAPKDKPFVIGSPFDTQGIKLKLDQGFAISKGNNVCVMVNEFPTMKAINPAENKDIKQIKPNKAYDKLSKIKHGRYQAKPGLIEQVKESTKNITKVQDKEDETAWQL